MNVLGCTDSFQRKAATAQSKTFLKMPVKPFVNDPVRLSIQRYPPTLDIKAGKFRLMGNEFPILCPARS